MPAMTRVHAALCRSAPWRGVTRRVILPWALQGFALRGDVLEIGAGSGAMAEEALTSHPSITLTATDFDDDMVAAMTPRLSPFGDRAHVQQADATALPFSDQRFDVVLSWVMLHHTVEWERALAEAVRVLRPGGHLVGDDLLSSPPLRMLHRHDHDRLRLMKLGELQAAVRALPVEVVRLEPSLGGLVVRFTLQKR